MSNNEGRVLHFGDYDGQEIDLVIEMDPAYILWAIDNIKGHGISPAQAAKARTALEQRTDWECDQAPISTEEAEEMLSGYYEEDRFVLSDDY